MYKIEVNNLFQAVISPVCASRAECDMREGVCVGMEQPRPHSEVHTGQA